ncbi:hypothetical protein EC973_007563 [Apophysomyces ossiformis]|uniref:Uncharacterized protein n=1 Tax=Apophysomyces ossiformis TaxID=679940 RepID=A0A8H7BPL7_9FUNG|nr:hypothetical protein EC973_007563 [Apophysomyces ossiformis]
MHALLQHLPNKSKYEFFNTTPLDERSLEKYYEHQTKSQNGQSDKDSGNNPSCPKSLRKEFIDALTAISKKDLPRDVKTRLGRLIKKCKEKPVSSKKPQQQEQQQQQQQPQQQPQPQQIFHISAPQGTFGAIGGDRSVVTNITGNQKADNVDFSDRESEEDDMEYDADPRSDLTNDYHPGRMLDYTVEELVMFDSGPEDIGEETDDSISNENTLHGTNDSANASASNTPTTVRHKKSWIVYDFNVIRSLEKFRAVSKTIAPKKLSDMRLLSSSITRYMDMYDTEDEDSEKTEDIFNMIDMDLQVAEGTVSLNSKIVNWSNELSEGERSVGGKRRASDQDNPHFKPDFIVFTTHSRDRYDLAVSEVKPPSNATGNNVAESDLVKIGKEMAWMLNALINK